MEQVILSYLEKGSRKVSFKSFLMSTGQFLHKVTLPDHNDVTPLHHLARQYAESKSPDVSIKIINVMHYLVKMGANMELTDVNGNSPYHLMTPGQPLFWEMVPYCSVDIKGDSADYFSNTKSVSILNKFFTRPTTLYSKNRYNLTPITLFQIKNLSTEIQTLIDIFPVTIRCHEIVEMRLLKEFGPKKSGMSNLFLASIKHGIPITSKPFTVQEMNQSDREKRSLLEVTLLNSTFSIMTLKEYMWLLMPQLTHFCRRIESISPLEILNLGVDCVTACFECLLFMNTHLPISFGNLNFIQVYFKFLLKFQFHKEVKLVDLKPFILGSRNNLSKHYAFAKTPPQYPFLFIVLFITTWMENRPDDMTEGHNILRGLGSNVDRCKLHSQQQEYEMDMPECLINISDIFMAKKVSNSIHSTLTRKQLLKKKATL